MIDLPGRLGPITMFNEKKRKKEMIFLYNRSPVFHDLFFYIDITQIMYLIYYMK